MSVTRPTLIVLPAGAAAGSLEEDEEEEEDDEESSEPQPATASAANASPAAKTRLEEVNTMSRFRLVGVLVGS